MRSMRTRPAKALHAVPAARSRRQQSRVPMTFALMYSAQDARGGVLMGDGSVTDLSSNGLGIRGNVPVKVGTELTLFLYLPDGQDPLFVMEAKVAWSTGHRFGVEMLTISLREKNRLRYFLRTHLAEAA